MAFTIIVLHGEFQDDYSLGQHVPVAQVTAYDTDVNEALERAWERTQNIGNSWSQDHGVQSSNGQVLSVTQRLADLPVHDGKTYGLRSTMVGDRFLVCDGENLPLIYEAASFGFKIVK